MSQSIPIIGSQLFSENRNEPHNDIKIFCFGDAILANIFFPQKAISIPLTFDSIFSKVQPPILEPVFESTPFTTNYYLFTARDDLSAYYHRQLEPDLKIVNISLKPTFNEMQPTHIYKLKPYRINFENIYHTTDNSNDHSNNRFKREPPKTKKAFDSLVVLGKYAIDNFDYLYFLLPPIIAILLCILPRKKVTTPPAKPEA